MSAVRRFAIGVQIWPFVRELNQSLRKVRELAGLIQTDLAERLNVGESRDHARSDMSSNAFATMTCAPLCSLTSWVTRTSHARLMNE
jgi:hypothetical protein